MSLKRVDKSKKMCYYILVPNEGRKGGLKLLNTNLLKAAITRAGLTQQGFAEAIGISQNTLTAKLKGKRCFNLDEIDRTCDVLGISENEEKCAIFLSSSSLVRDKM